MTRTATKVKGLRFKERAAQGELGIFRLPAAYKLPVLRKPMTPTSSNGRKVLIIGHSETGHHHVMDPEKTTVYELPEQSKMLVVRETDVLTHLREHDTHTPLVFEPGKYMVKTLKEFDITKQQAVYSRD